MHTIIEFLVYFAIFVFVVFVVAIYKAKPYDVATSPSIIAASDGARLAVGDRAAWNRLTQMRDGGSISVDELLLERAELIANSSVGAGSASDGKTVVLTAGLENKIQAIKMIRRACPQYRLIEAKYLVDHIPQVLCSQVAEPQAENARNELEAAGLKVRVV